MSAILNPCLHFFYIYQIPNTEHMAYRLVRSLVYERGVGIREAVWVVEIRYHDNINTTTRDTALDAPSSLYS